MRAYLQPTFPVYLLAVAAAFMTATSAHAHFPWLSTDEEGRALLFFSESPAERDYHTPDAVAEARVVQIDAEGEPREIELETIETEDFVGRQSEARLEGDGAISTSCQYGVYHGTLLNYYAKHYTNLKATEGEEKSSLDLDVQAVAIEEGVKLHVTWQGEPLVGASVSIIDSNGDRAEKKTNREGDAKFYHIVPGQAGFIIGHTDKSVSGELKGEEFKSASHYLTLTLNIPSDESKSASAIPPLPEAIASFGAVVSDGFLYAYSGHTGTAHDHSRENLSKHFCRIPVEGGEWEELPMETPLQGFPLVAYEGLIYRVGGMTAHNAPDEDEDLHSVDEFACFDPQTKTWAKLPSLPEPRSSHDAVVVGSQLYVVGGWKLSGSDDGEWHDTAWRIDLQNVEEGWQPITKPPFLRRALAVSHTDDTLVVIGGIDDDDDISRHVDGLDLETGEWKQLAELPGEGMHGFGVSAWNLGGALYVSGTEGVLYQLSDDGQAWNEAAELEERRFFHRLLPADDQRLLVIAGASLDREKHVADCEFISVAP